MKSALSVGDAPDEPFRFNPHNKGVIRYINLKDLVELGRFPRYPEDAMYAQSLDSIKRDESVMIFISHSWLGGTRNPPHPDLESGEKYRLCVNGLQKIKSDYAKDAKDCYVWFDYGCVNQNEESHEELKEMISIMRNCDLMFTPIINYEPTSDRTYSTVSHYWNTYLKRGWCRIEMFYAANIPILANKDCSPRCSMFTGALASACRANRRPHFLYQSSEDMLNQPAVPIRPMQNYFLDLYDPQKGDFTKSKDKIESGWLMKQLKPFIDENPTVVGYVGEYNALGERHGKGCYTDPLGDVYSGEWQSGKKCGPGVVTFGNGYKYTGVFKDGKPIKGGYLEDPNGAVSFILHNAGCPEESTTDALLCRLFTNTSVSYGCFLE